MSLARWTTSTMLAPVLHRFHDICPICSIGRSHMQQFLVFAVGHLQLLLKNDCCCSCLLFISVSSMTLSPFSHQNGLFVLRLKGLNLLPHIDVSDMRWPRQCNTYMGYLKCTWVMPCDVYINCLCCWASQQHVRLTLDMLCGRVSLAATFT